MVIRKLKNHEYAQAHVEIENDDDSIIYRLISYSTHVATVTETAAGWFLDCYGLYSMTTRSHISWFLADIGSPFTFNDAKFSVEGGRLVKGYKPGARFCLVHNGFTYNPADLQLVIDFASYKGFNDYTIFDAETGELVYEQ